MKSKLDSGLIGEIYNVFVEVGQYLPDWRTNKNYKNSVSASSNLGGGALLELSHEIDYTQWLIGNLTPKFSVLRSSKALELEVEDSADILSVNSKGAVISIHLDFLQRRPYRKCRFIGSNGSLEWDLIKNNIVLNSSDRSEIIFSDPDWDKNKMYLNMILDFENLILGKPNQCITPLEAANTISFISKVKI
ncbi:Gfo/Idh/MocA family protein [Psychrobacter sp. ER1]|uniref:Gfo/Idh/MocA family protein n=1 Tax=Psychrobacter sp. ER1 TaxID=3406645 RepID=UPI003B42E188